MRSQLQTDKVLAATVQAYLIQVTKINYGRKTHGM